jgi:hypothetical protein
MVLIKGIAIILVHITLLVIPQKIFTDTDMKLSQNFCDHYCSLSRLSSSRAEILKINSDVIWADTTA